MKDLFKLPLSSHEGLSPLSTELCGHQTTSGSRGQSIGQNENQANKPTTSMSPTCVSRVTCGQVTSIPQVSSVPEHKMKHASNEM